MRETIQTTAALLRQALGVLRNDPEALRAVVSELGDSDVLRTIIRQEVNAVLAKLPTIQASDETGKTVHLFHKP